MSCDLHLPVPNLSLSVCLHSCIVTCNTQSHICFYNGKFTLLAWYTELNLDAIVSISFSKEWKKRQQEYRLDSKPLITRYTNLLYYSVQPKEPLNQYIRLLLAIKETPVRLLSILKCIANIIGRFIFYIINLKLDAL